MEEKIPGGEGCPSIFSEMPWKLHIFLFLTECVVLGLMFIRKITLVDGKKHSEVFNSGLFSSYYVY